MVVGCLESRIWVSIAGISSRYPSSRAAQTGLCWTWLESSEIEFARDMTHLLNCDIVLLTLLLYMFSYIL